MRTLLLMAMLAKPQPHSVTLSWADATNPSGTTYNVYRANGACSPTSAFVKINVQPIDAKSYVDLKVTASTAYCYAVSAFDVTESAMTPGVTAVIPRK